MAIEDDLPEGADHDFLSSGASAMFAADETLHETPHTPR